MASYDELKEKINKLGLKSDGKRDLPLFTLSCISESYFCNLREILGITYNGLVAIGIENHFQSILNEEFIASEVERTLNIDNIKKMILPKMRDIANETKRNLVLLEYLAQKDAPEFLKRIIEIYPRYFSTLAVYNCYMRFVGNNSGVLPPELVSEISRDREDAAKIYPEIEKSIIVAFENYGKVNGFDGSLLRCLTLSELKQYLNEKGMPKKILEVLEKRKKTYLFIFIDNKEEIVEDEDFIRHFKEDFFIIHKGIKEIKGHTISPGKVRGIAYNLESSRKMSDLENVILIASMTHPDDAQMLRKCLAIIVDEGGILSHAAIFSREFKIPCVVSTRIATKTISTGDFLEVDADNGIIRIIEKVKPLENLS